YANTHWRFLIVILVVTIDTAAYLFGQFIGGPKIAPRISPSKTWSGFLGGVIFCYIWMIFVLFLYIPRMYTSGLPYGATYRVLAFSLVLAVGLSAVAQLGDFFESWMKRKACVKDSGTLIPGHGGLFDRLDGLVAVAFFCGLSVWMLIGSLPS
ncbi:MAG: phosphatidate cytidylyltransferase, partial [Alphaproteobacteria bacterium]|nr:phosphatidate cytidylyltransferase [Alphaproteobacteria bacterium]